MADKKVKVILQDSDFQKELVYANDKLVLVDFFATWCKPCDEIAPAVEELNKNYHRSVVLLKVDIDACSNTARRYEVKSLPTFTFFHKTEKLDQVLGADKESLEAGIVKHLNNMKHPLPSADDDSDTTSAVSPTVDSFTNVSVKGQMNLNIIIDKGSSECLNECDPHPFINALINDPSYLQSDCDEQLIIALSFSQPIRLHSLQLVSVTNPGCEPKTVKLFINQTYTLDFDSAETNQPIQTLQLCPENVSVDGVIPLAYLKYQNVQHLTIFIKDNQGGAETTIINYIGIHGNLLDSTNMKDFKRVSGDKGETH